MTTDSDFELRSAMAVKAVIEAMKVEDPSFEPGEFFFKVTEVEEDVEKLGVPLIEKLDGSKVWGV